MSKADDSSAPTQPLSARRNARWVGVAQGARLGVQVLGLLILSRLLTPEDFGLVAMASVVANFAILLRDLGTGAALIQKPVLHDDTVLATFWLNAAIGVVLALLVAGGAFFIARGFEAPPLAPLLMVLALAFPLNGLSVVHQSLLERESRFSTVARIEIVSFVAALITAVVSALMGAGAYSLVLQTLAAALLGCVQFWIASPWRPRFAWPWQELRKLSGFSSNLFGFHVMNYFSRNADSMVIGRFFDAASLGAYSLAYRLMLFPLQNLTAVANRALFPVFSRQHGQLSEIAGLYLRTLSIIALFTAPLMAGLFVLREPFVNAVLGPQWQLASVVIAWLAPCGFIQSLITTSGCVFMARGRTALMFRLGVFCAVVQVSSFLIGTRWGVPGVAACYFVANLFCAVPLAVCVARLLNIAVHEMLLAVMRPALLALVMAMAVAVAQHVLAQQGMHALLQLMLLILGGALFYAALVHVLARSHEVDALRLLTNRA